MDERDYKAMNDELKREGHIGDTNKMVTAVEWYYEQTVVLGKTNYAELLEQSKQMEKEHIVNAHLTGLIYPLETDASLQAEEYYEQTFKK